MKGVNHYKRDGTLHTGGTHKMPDGSLRREQELDKARLGHKVWQAIDSRQECHWRALPAQKENCRYV